MTATTRRRGDRRTGRARTTRKTSCGLSGVEIATISPRVSDSVGRSSFCHARSAIIAASSRINRSIPSPRRLSSRSADRNEMVEPLTSSIAFGFVRFVSSTSGSGMMSPTVSKPMSAMSYVGATHQTSVSGDPRRRNASCPQASVLPHRRPQPTIRKRASDSRTSRWPGCGVHSRSTVAAIYWPPNLTTNPSPSNRVVLSDSMSNSCFSE